MFKFKWFYYFLFVYVPLTLAQLEPALHFEHLSQRQGLSQNSAMALLQDSQGFLWIGTDDGLNLYDGYQFTVFNPDDASNQVTISGNAIRALYEDQNHNIWIGTVGNGLNKLNKTTWQVETYKTRPDDKSSISSNAISSITGDSQGNIWIGTYKQGLNQYDAAAKTFKRFPIHYQQRTIKVVSSLALDESSGRLWVGTRQGLYRFNTEKTAFDKTWETSKTFNVLKNKFIWRLKVDSHNNLWVATLNSGLFQIDQNGTVVRIFNNQSQESEHKPIATNVRINNQSISSNTVYAIEEDDKGVIWVGTLNGVNRWDPAIEKMTFYTHSPSNPNSISDNQIISVLADRYGTLWFGSYNKGLNKLDLSTQQFQHFTFNQSMPDCISANGINSIIKDSQSNIWTGSFNEGLYRLNHQTKSCESFQHIQDDINSLSNNTVLSIVEDNHKTIWAGTERGLNRFNPETKRFFRYNQGTNATSLSSDRIITLFNDLKHGLWVGTASGVYRYNHEQDNFIALKGLDGNDVLLNVEIYALDFDNADNLWIATNNGLIKYAQQSKALTHFKHNENDNRSISNDQLYDLHIASNGNVWLATANGLNQFRPDLGVFEKIGKKHGLPGTAVYAIEEDMSGNLWLSGSKGLAQFDPKSKRIEVYDPADGLQDFEYTLGSYYDSAKDEMFFTGINGFDRFNPKQLTKTVTAPDVYITQLFINSKRVEADDTVFKNSSFKNITYLDAIVLPYEKNSIGLAFSGLHYANVADNQYAYKMLGIDADWAILDASERRVNYAQLSPGAYSFMVKASNKDGQWSKEFARLNITVLPPFWLTWWAYLIYLILLFLFPTALYYYRTRMIRAKAEQLERIVEQRTSELETEKLLVEKLLAQKNEDFANLSHEFRTPLTLVLGPIKNLLRSNIRHSTREKLEVVKRNAYRLLRMVDQLLHMEKFKVQQIYQKDYQNVKQIGALITQSFKELSQAKNIQFNVKNDETIWIFLTNDTIEKILLNLLSNALKYTEAGDVIEVSISRTSKGFLRISVSDTGIGISDDLQAKIFDRYYRILDGRSENTSGAGIGLALIKEIIDYHHGSITVTSTLGHGSTFTVLLPDALPDKPDIAEKTINTEIVELELESIQRQTMKHSDNNDKVSNDLSAQNNDTRVTILVVEDNSEMLNYICETLTEQFYCISATNGKQGIKLAIEMVPDLIISDVMMPEMNGYALSNVLKENDKTCHIPLILLTALSDRESRIKGWKEHADEFISKPFDEEELILRVNNLLTIRQLLRQRFNQKLNALDGPSNINTIYNAELSKKDRVFLESLDKLLETHYSNDEFMLTTMAAEVAMSNRQFQRKLKAIVDMTPRDYLRNFRLKKSKLFLANQERISVVAFKVGFASSSYFAKCFKAQFGITASEFQNSITHGDITKD